jgi:hypothetical protein
MRKVITLQNQHFLKKNYTYNFFRSSVKFNTFFLKNSFFLFKFYKLFKFFFFINFFLQKKIIFNDYKLSTIKSGNYVLLKKKNFLNNYNNLYGQNYALLGKNSNTDLIKTQRKTGVETKSDIINYNYINILNYNQFLNIILYNNIK